MNAQSAKDDEYDDELDDEESHDDEFDDDEEFDDDFEDDEALEAGEEPDDEDPTWWVPYGVLALILLLGLLGFFGAFNKALGFLAAPVDVQADAHAEAPTSHATAAAAPKAPAKPIKMPPAAKGEYFGAKHILVMYKGSKRAPTKITRTKDEAKTRAIEAGKRAKKGDKFEELVKEYSDEPGAGARGGNLGRFRKGTMVPQFQAAVEKMKVGDISDPVETPFGFHIIVRTQ